MDAITSHVSAHADLYGIIGLVMLIIGLIAFDLRTARLRSASTNRKPGSDQERTVHQHHPWAGIDESGP